MFHIIQLLQSSSILCADYSASYCTNNWLLACSIVTTLNFWDYIYIYIETMEVWGLYTLNC